VEKNIMPDKPLEMNKIDLLIDKAIKIEPKAKKVSFEKNQALNYEKLILALGSEPALIPIKGVDKKGVWLIKKDFEYLKALRKAALKAKNIVIIGGGFIGVELAEELSAIKGLSVSLAEKLDHCLTATFDPEFAEEVENKLKKKGVQIQTRARMEEILGEKEVKAVKLNNQEIPADLVILAIGAKPNSNPAQKAGLKLGECQGVEVNEYLETSEKDILAIGDCARTQCLLTKEFTPAMLASTACHEARIAVANLNKKENLIKNTGTLAVFSTSVDGLVMATTGLGEQAAKEKGFEIVIEESGAPNHHPGSLPDTQTIKTRLIFDQTSDRLLGGQLSGPESVSEMINILALAIQKKATAHDLGTLQVATHPLLTAAPTVYPLISATQGVLERIR
jgi:NADH oxidase (H2O2-forming)